MKAGPQPGSLFFAAWTSVVAAWVGCRLGMWRVAADRQGVHVSRFWAVRCVPWSAMGHVELRRDGLLEFAGPCLEHPGRLFAAAMGKPSARSIQPRTRMADTLTVFSLYPGLRSQSRADRAAKGTAFAWWGLPLAVVLFAAAEIRHR
ncbi:hypothetical protein [Streptomyces sp. NPDC051310]|uniref:hypothetical protein n=1 Tax=Streptomyces sp. NPDC051310 TaxID=3365649 RepID=UPI0037AFDB07